MSESAPNRRREPSLYDVLQISPKASPSVIQAAYRVHARNYHPDVNSAPDAAGLMSRINAAYDVLGDPERRARYDADHLRPARAAIGRPAAQPRPSRGGGRLAPRAVTIQAEYHAVSPAGRAIAMGAAVAIFAVVWLLGWMLFDALDERPTLGVQPRVATFELNVQPPWSSPLDHLVRDVDRGSAGPCRAGSPPC